MLIKQGKTNWKFLLIVVILTTIVGGGVLYCQYTSVECNSPTDCEGKTHIMCVGQWECISNQCSWNCEVEETESLITKEEALAIAQQNTDCSMTGVLTDEINYNTNTKTWWIDLERMPELEKDGCNPACVVNETTKTAEVNWRCTGLLPEVEGLPEEISNNETFINWIADWQKVKPNYVIDKFTKINERSWIFEGKEMGEFEIDQKILEAKREGEGYSSDKTRLVRIGGYPDPFEIDQDVVLFNLLIETYQFLKTCGTACWFERVFWINNDQFIVIRTGEAPYPDREESGVYRYCIDHGYKHSLFLYDLEKNIVKEFVHSEIISCEELEEFKNL